MQSVNCRVFHFFRLATLSGVRMKGSRVKLMLIHFAVWLFAATAFASSLPKVIDIYTSIPREHLDIVTSATRKPLTKEEKLKLIKVEDQANAYLELGGGDTDSFGGGQIALFKKKAGGFLVGLRTQFGDSTTQIKMLTTEGGVWKDVTKAVLPTITDAMADERFKAKVPSSTKQQGKLSDGASGTYGYVLPRKGTTIKVVVMSDSYKGKPLVLWRLGFDGERFKILKD